MDPVVYSVDGRRVHSREDFFDLVGEAVSGPGTYFGKNFDAFSDCLSGGYGTPDDGAFRFVLENANAAREALGYPETLAWLQHKVRNCHPSNVESVKLEIAEAEAERGPTIFDIFVDIFKERLVPLQLH